jgi:hypothetical protein
MADSVSERDPIEELAESFLARYRARNNSAGSSSRSRSERESAMGRVPSGGLRPPTCNSFLDSGSSTDAVKSS